MKKAILRSFILMLLVLFPISSQAFELAVEGGLSLNSPSVSNTDGSASAFTYSSKISIAYGALLGFSMMPGFQLESGLMMSPRKSSLADATTGIALGEVSMNQLMVPVMMRFTALPLISVGAGAYYMMGLGKISTTNLLTNGVDETEFDAPDGIKKSGFGALASVRLEMPMAPLIHLLLDGRYLMDLSERSNDPTNSYKSKELQILAGISLGI